MESKNEVMVNKTTQLIMFSILFILFVVQTTATIVYARDTRQDIENLNITSQNKCVVRVVLSNLPPINVEQFDTILRNYDSCIAEQRSGR